MSPELALSTSYHGVTRASRGRGRGGAEVEGRAYINPQVHFLLTLPSRKNMIIGIMNYERALLFGYINMGDIIADCLGIKFYVLYNVLGLSGVQLK